MTIAWGLGLVGEVVWESVARLLCSRWHNRFVTNSCFGGSSTPPPLLPCLDPLRELAFLASLVVGNYFCALPACLVGSPCSDFVVGLCQPSHSMSHSCLISVPFPGLRSLLCSLVFGSLSSVFVSCLVLPSIGRKRHLSVCVFCLCLGPLSSVLVLCPLSEV